MNILSPLFPPRCPLCGKSSPGLCADCRDALPRPRFVDGYLPGRVQAAAPFLYRGVVRSGIHAFKFRGRVSAAKFFAGEMTAALRAAFPGERFDAVTYVPMSLFRDWRRGYNQSRLLAADAAKSLNAPLKSTLMKVKRTKRQSSLKTGRFENVRGAYKLKADVSGMKLLLIDDVLTSGATLLECVNVLKDGGAGKVICLTAAKKGD